MDFTGINGSLTFAPGEISKTISLTVINDNLIETNETFSVVLASPSAGSVLGPVSAVVVTITEAKAGLMWSSVAVSTNEPASGVTNTVTVALVRSGNTNQVTTVDYTFVDGTATNGADYLGTNGTMAAGVVTTNVTFWVRGDGLAEGNETFTVALGNANAATVVLLSTNAVVTILDYDAVFAFTTNAVSVVENITNVVLTVVRTGSTNTSMTVAYVLVDGTATNGLDYVGSSNLLTFAAGVRSNTISLMISNDTIVEGSETFTVALANASAGAVLWAYSNSVVTIIDNDVRFQWATTTTNVAESVGVVTLTVYRTGATNLLNAVGYMFILWAGVIMGSPAAS